MPSLAEQSMETADTYEKPTILLQESVGEEDAALETEE